MRQHADRDHYRGTLAGSAVRYSDSISRRAVSNLLLDLWRKKTRNIDPYQRFDLLVGNGVEKHHQNRYDQRYHQAAARCALSPHGIFRSLVSDTRQNQCVDVDGSVYVLEDPFAEEFRRQVGLVPYLVIDSL